MKRRITVLILTTIAALMACNAPNAVTPTPAPTDPTNPLPTTSGDFGVSSPSPISAILEWKSVAGAQRYVLKRGATPLIEAWNTQTKFRDTDLTPNSPYRYTLEARDGAGKTLQTFSAEVTTRSGSKDRSSADLPLPPYSRAFETFNWKPDSRFDSAPLWLHNTYWAFGADNKVYPTWHPPTYSDSSGKPFTFGHEHGRDPSKSSLYGVTGPIPFGYISEQLEPGNSGGQRNEDHVGHKIEYKNDVRVGLPNVDSIDNFTAGSGPVCSVMTKLHQGTHSADAFTNNLHELYYFVRCANGVELRWQSFHVFGTAGSVVRTCDSDTATAPFTPATSPTLPNQSHRGVPDAKCLEILRAKVKQGGDASAEYYANYGEDWPTGFIHGLHRDNAGRYYDNWGQRSAERNPAMQFEVSAGTYFVVTKPSRYYDASKPGNLGRRVEMCFDATLKIDHPDCQRARAANAAWDSPDSPFKGSSRTVHFDWVTLKNKTNQTVFYSNATGTETRPQPDAARGIVLPQLVSPAGSEQMYYFGQLEADYDAVGVHAPN